MENVKKDESNFDEVRNLGRKSEIEIINNSKDEMLTVVKTVTRNRRDVNIERISAIMLFRHRNGYTPLVQSIFEGSSLQEVKDVLENPDYRPVEEELPLHAAAQLGRDDVVQYLLEKRHLWTNLGLSDVLNTLEDENLTPLYQAVMLGLSSLETIKRLATEGNVNIADKDQGMGPLHWAARNRAPVTIEYLATIKTIDLNVQDKKEYTPLHWTSEALQPEKCFENVIESLKTTENGKIRDNDGMTPLHCAISSNHCYIIKHLVTEENVNMVNSNGSTPLHLAVFLDSSLDIFELLLSHDSIKPNMVDHNRSSPLHLAVTMGKIDKARIL